jgi:hypothetical protein
MISIAQMSRADNRRSLPSLRLASCQNLCMALAAGSRRRGGTHPGRSALRDTGRAGFRVDQ